MKYQSSVRFVLVGAIMSCIAVSCGGDSPAPGVSVSNQPNAAVASPQRIVVLSPTHTEIVFAIGGADQVVAVDDQSNYPPEVADRVTALSGFEPNVEAIVSYEPDLVVIGDDFTGLAEQLSSIGIESWTSPAPLNIEELFEQISDLGARIGHASEADELVKAMRSDIDSIVAASSVGSLSYFHELDGDYYTVTSNTFIGSLYGMFGLRNIADAAEANSDYPQLSAEFILSQNPDLIFLADSKCCAVTPDSVAARPGWIQINAVREGRIVTVDDDIASRWGPRVVDFVRAIAEAISAAKGS